MANCDARLRGEKSKWRAGEASRFRGLGHRQRGPRPRATPIRMTWFAAERFCARFGTGRGGHKGTACHYVDVLSVCISERELGAVHAALSLFARKKFQSSSVGHGIGHFFGDPANAVSSPGIPSRVRLPITSASFALQTGSRAPKVPLAGDPEREAEKYGPAKMARPSDFACRLKSCATIGQENRIPLTVAAEKDYLGAIRSASTRMDASTS